METKKKSNNETEIRLESPKVSGPLEVVRHTMVRLQLHPQKIAGVDGYVIDLDEELFEGALAQVITEESRFVFYIDFREKATETARSNVVEFITRANFGIIFGNFEIDLEDGTVRYKTSIDFQDDELSYALVRNVIFSARDGAKLYGKELQNVMKSLKSPVDAISDIEKD